MAIAVAALVGGAAPAVGQQAAVDKSAWMDATRSVEERADAVLSAMTLREKVGQLWTTNGIGGVPTGDVKSLVADNEIYSLIRDGDLGSIMNTTHTPTINALQRVAVEESRLGVPLVCGRDVIHGYKTVFPIPLGQAASWNPELVEEASAIAAREARSVGIHWTFAPMIDIARDPRWGRIAEGCGEDPYLTAAFAAAMVRGFQGNDLSADDRVAACAKHFVGYGAAEGGRDYNTTVISPSLLHDIYLPPYQAAVDAGVATIMVSFNEINGVPSSGNKHILRDILRDRWGFQGYVVGDWESMREMIPHGFAADERAVALLSSTAGLNMEMVSQCYHKNLQRLVEAGTVPEETVDGLVRDVLRVKFRLGLFEKPLADEDKESVMLTDEHRDVARRLARQSVVLLKNDDKLLPLDKEKTKRIALIGPLADAPWDQLGTWVPDGHGDDSVSLLKALKESEKDGVTIDYLKAMDNDLDRKTDLFDDAVKLAEKADVIVLAVGEQARISGEASARALIDLPGAQNELIARLAKTGKPLVLVVMAGRPLTIGRQLPHAGAILWSFHAGTMAGPALADLLWGVESPSGKLPITFVKSVGQIPLYYNHKMTGRPPREYDFAKDSANYDEDFDQELGFNSNYLDVGPYPLYPFGYGLSYAEFEYDKAELSTDKLRAGQTLAVRAPVKNTGDVAADEVVQLYVRDVVGSLTRPVRELKGFRRVHLEPGESETVEFALAADDLAYTDNEEKRVLEPGTVEIYVGGSSLAEKMGEIEVVE